MRNRRTKDQIQKDKYNSEVDAYNWYVVNLKTQKVESGFEYKEDAIDLLNDYDDKKQYKVVAKKTLKSMGIEIPNESWKYAKGGSLEAHGIQVGDTFIKTVSGAIQKVKDKNGNIVFIDLSNGYRDTQPPLPFEDGGYTDLSKSKPEVMNESKMSKYEVEIPEIDIEKIRTIDLHITDNKILSLDDSIRVLKQIYDKGSINAYEEVKILYLDNSNKVIGVYNHSKGGVTGTVIDVEMVCALAVKCLARGVIMSHNHPSGSLKFSDADIKVTRELKNALNLFKIALLDSIVITDNGFTSMTNEGILANGGSLSRFDNGGSLIGNQKRIDLNDNGKIDSEDFKLLRSSMNGAWRNEHRHVNQSNSKQHYEVRYAKPRPNRTGYKGKRNFAEGGDLGMGISTKFKNYVSNHTISESFLYNNRMLSSREITPQQYELNRDYVLAMRSERGFAEGGDLGIEEEIDLTDDNRLRVKELTYEYKKPTAKELAEKHNSGAYEFMEQDKFVNGGDVNKDVEINPAIKSFIDKLKKNAKYTKGNEQKNVKGVSYRFDEYKLINPSTFIVNEFKRLVEKSYGTLSLSNGYDFRRINLVGNKVIVADLSKYKGGHTDYINFRELVVLNKAGGETTFQDKSDAIAKRFVGKKVEPKYQKEYGKVYSKDEAKEVGNKITGSMVSKEKMMSGGKTKKGNGEAMLLAKKIRKDGEKWTDAVKRAWLQLK